MLLFNQNTQVYLSLRLGYWVREVGHEVCLWSDVFSHSFLVTCYLKFSSRFFLNWNKTTTSKAMVWIEPPPLLARMCFFTFLNIWCSLFMQILLSYNKIVLNFIVSPKMFQNIHKPHIWVEIFLLLITVFIVELLQSKLSVSKDKIGNVELSGQFVLQKTSANSTRET